MPLIVSDREYGLVAGVPQPLEIQDNDIPANGRYSLFVYERSGDVEFRTSETGVSSLTVQALGGTHKVGPMLPVYGLRWIESATTQNVRVVIVRDDDGSFSIGPDGDILFQPFGNTDRTTPYSQGPTNTNWYIAQYVPFDGKKYLMSGALAQVWTSGNGTQVEARIVDARTGTVLAGGSRVVTASDDAEEPPFALTMQADPPTELVTLEYQIRKFDGSGRARSGGGGIFFTAR